MFSLRIETKNAAFSQDNGTEITRILQNVAEQVQQGGTAGACVDVNGNLVGEWEITGII